MRLEAGSSRKSSRKSLSGITELPAVRRALRLSIWDGVFANLYGNLTGGVFLVGYMLALQASEVQVGLLAAFPLVANVAQLFSTYFIQLLGRRRPLAFLGGACARLIWLVLIAASLYPVAPGPLLLLSLCVVALSQIGTAVNNLAWISWMADLVREEVRGRYFSLRNAILGSVALLATLAGGRFLDGWKASHPHGELEALRILFLIGVVCGVIQLNYTAVTLYAVLSSIMDLLSVQLWGRLADRFTNRRVLLFCSFFLGLVPFGWMFTSSDNHLLVGLLRMQSGLFWSGIHLCTANLVLKISPATNRSVYYSTFNTVAGVVAVIAPVIGGMALTRLPGFLGAPEAGWSPFVVIKNRVDRPRSPRQEITVQLFSEQADVGLRIRNP